MIRLPIFKEYSSKELTSLFACVCECLQNPDRLGEVENLSERIEEMIHFMTCNEFIEHFVSNDGANTIFGLINSIT